MKVFHATHFMLMGMGMLAAPELWPDYFGTGQGTSVLWLRFMGGLQVAGSLLVVAREAWRGLRGLAAWDILDISLKLPEGHGVAPPSIYALLEESEEETRALRLQQQLLQPAAA